MRNLAYLPLLLGISCLIVSNSSFSQSVRRDSSSQKSAFNNTLTLFYESIGKQSPLYNGAEYNFYDPTITGNAYFADVNAFTSGEVIYDKILFNGVPMIYDLYIDEVVVILYNHFTKFTLVKQKVTSFDYLGHHFINIDADTLRNNTEIKSGYYDELYQGKLQVLVKRSKNIQTTSSQSSVQSYFNFSVNYYIKKNNIYYPISGKGSMLDVLKDKKKQLQQYIKDNQLNFRKEPEEAMVKIAAYYDQLTNQR